MIDLTKFDVNSLRLKYQQHPSYGLINIPRFLPDTVTQECAEELDSLPLSAGKHFTRRGSCMYEYNDLTITPGDRDWETTWYVY